jgi:hypothetical protein
MAFTQPRVMIREQWTRSCGSTPSPAPSRTGSSIYQNEPSGSRVTCRKLTTFPSGKYDDQTDSTSQALEWAKNQNHEYGLFEYWRQEAEKLKTRQRTQSVEGPNFRNAHEWRSSW